MDAPETAPERARGNDLAHLHQTRLVTLVFTDLVDSVVLRRQLGDQAATTLLQTHRQIVRDLLKRAAGAEEIETAGDSFLLLFVRPSDAVKFALVLEQQTGVLAKERTVALAVRIGVHVGEVVIEEHVQGPKLKDLYGSQIDLCARVMSLAQGGQILLTRAVFDSARQALKGEELHGLNELQWLDHGPYVLKGIEDPVDICEVGEVGVGVLKAPAASDKARPRIQPGQEPVLGWRPAATQVIPNTRWFLEQKLGEGGFGEVWLGRHQHTKERRVFKFCFQAERVRFLKREMTLFRVLKERVGDHANIVRLHDVILDQPPYYVEMDYVEGADLRSWCDEHGGIAAVPLETRLEIVAQAAEGLQAAHEAGIIHRDIKPANILIGGKGIGPSEIRVKLTDFGIGQVVSEESLKGITRAGFTQTILSDSSSSQTGTQLYLAPELLAGKPASTRSDIYSLGVVLYQLLVGDFAQPVTGDWANEIQDPLLRDDLQHCLAGKPQERFAGVDQLAKRLRGLPERRAELGRERAEKAALERAAYRRGIVRAASLASLMVTLIAGLAVFSFSVSRNEKRQRQSAEERARDLRRLLYVGDMSKAFHAIKEGNLRLATTLVTNYLNPRPNEEDLRGWEWRYLWQLCQPSEHAVLANTGQAMNCAVFSPRGGLLAIAGLDQTVRVLEVASGKAVTNLSGFDGEIDFQAVKFSPDGRLLAAKGGQIIRVWSTETWQAIFRDTNGLSEWNGTDAVLFSADGKTLATRMQTAPPGQKRVGFWDLESCRLLNRLDSPIDAGGMVMTYSTDGKLLALVATNELHVLDAHSLRMITNMVHPLPFGWEYTFRVMSIAFSKNLMAAGYRLGEIKIWDTRTWAELASWRAHPSQLLALDFSPDGKLLASGGSDCRIQVWDLATVLKPGINAATITPQTTLQGHTDQIRSVMFAPNGRTLVSCGRDGTVRLWSVPSPDRALPLFGARPADDKFGWWFLEDGKHVVYADLNWHFSRADLSGATAPQPLKAPRDVLGNMEVSLDGKTVAVSKYLGDDSIQLWNLETGELKSTITGASARNRNDRHMAFAQGGLFISSYGGEIRILHLRDESREPVLITSIQVVGSPDLALSADGRVLAARPRPTEIGFWRLPDGHSLGAINVPPSPDFETFALSHDGRLLAYCSWPNSSPVLWDLSSRQSRKIPVYDVTSTWGHLAFAPDGKTLVLVTSEQSVIFWNLATGREIIKEENLAGIPLGPKFSANGENLALPLRLRHAPPLQEIEAKERASAKDRLAAAKDAGK